MEDLVKDFYESLTDRQLIIFCLAYGYNSKGVTLSNVEISSILRVTPETVQQSLARISLRLSQKRFRPLIQEMANYEVIE